MKLTRRKKFNGKKAAINYMNVLFHAADMDTLAEMAEAVTHIAARAAEEDEKPSFAQFAI